MLVHGGSPCNDEASFFDCVRIHNLLYCIIPGPKGTFVTWDFRHCSRWDKVRTSRDIPGCEGTFETWDFGHCSRWDKSGHPGISRDVKGHLRPGTLGIVLGGTSQDIPGYSGM